ncbi:uncharacterized protein LOC114865226 isoform X2 [Betta splendens]|nr:uncharacterized protein LOC114865226 isoform X2 [Betta splendens]XP_029022007.1 uncharacterized protein LOC114865226 isoform X2 [Betta splendens]
MDFQVQATIRLDCFQDKTQVFQILRSHDFVTERRNRNELRIKGGFVDLKSVKFHLEQLLEAPNPSDVGPSSHYPVSPGAVPTNHHTSEAGGTRNRSGSRNKVPPASVSSPSTSAPLLTGSSHSLPPSFSHGQHTLLVEGDVFYYAKRVRSKELRDIEERHEVALIWREVGESFRITLEGRNTKEAAGELQQLVERLHALLRTQEVPRTDMGPKGHAVLQRIQENSYISKSVLVCEMHDRLHLIGPSSESYALKQRLLEGSGHEGRTSDRSSRRRSSSQPASSRRGAVTEAERRRPLKQVVSWVKGLSKN